MLTYRSLRELDFAHPAGTVPVNMFCPSVLFGSIADEFELKLVYCDQRVLNKRVITEESCRIVVFFCEKRMVS